MRRVISLGSYRSCRWGVWKAFAAVLLICAPATAEQKVLPYVPVALQKDGSVTAASLDAMTVAVRPEVGEGNAQIVVMLHGFATPHWVAEKNFTIAAGRLREQSVAAHLRMGIVGVHWDSHVGEPPRWLSEAAAARVTSLLGMKKAVRNPYLAKTRLAREAGRTGARSVFFKLQEAFPRATFHVIAHSLGAEMVVAALAPAGSARKGESTEIDQPERELRLRMVTLVGADMDCDTFVRPGSTARTALRRADLWWVTVPAKGKADGVLELRRAAGKGDAVGNCGMKLEREDLDMLLRRRALVVDQKDIPATHSSPKYMTEWRAEAVVRSIAYLRDPESAFGKSSVLARLDNYLGSSAPASTDGDDASCLKLYRTWRERPATEDFGVIQVRGAASGSAGRARSEVQSQSDRGDGR
jgi:hypothetical protein